MRCISNQSSLKVVLIKKNKPFRWNFVKTLAIHASADRGYPYIHKQRIILKVFETFGFRALIYFSAVLAKSIHHTRTDTQTHIRNISSQVYKTQPVHRIFSLASCQTLHTSHHSVCNGYMYIPTLILIRNYNVFLFCPLRMWTCVRFRIGLLLWVCVDKSIYIYTANYIYIHVKGFKNAKLCIAFQSLTRKHRCKGIVYA